MTCHIVQKKEEKEKIKENKLQICSLKMSRGGGNHRTKPLQKYNEKLELRRYKSLFSKSMKSSFMHFWSPVCKKDIHIFIYTNEIQKMWTAKTP